MTRLFVACFAVITPVFPADYIPGAGPDLARVTVTCGDLGMLFRQNSQWTPGRIDFRGKAMTTEKSAYGTVFSFPGIGFIGTAHFENEPEDLQSVRFVLDGKTLESPAEAIDGNSFRLERISRIREFSLVNTIELKNNCIVETSTIATDQDVPLNLVYHFMHAWSTSVSEFLSGNDQNPEENLSGILGDGPEVARKFYVQKPVDWVAVYDNAIRRFAVSRLLQSPGGITGTSKIWNVPGSYRKYYYTSFQNETVPAGFNGTWKMVTGFGIAGPEDWKSEAEKLAQSLRRVD